ncbi:MAG: hypothetical protein V4787_16560 [Pseudomonadota bacterium]
MNNAGNAFVLPGTAQSAGTDRTPHTTSPGAVAPQSASLQRMEPSRAWLETLAEASIDEVSAALVVNPHFIHATGPDGRAAIHIAAERGAPALIRLLRAHGAVVTQRIAPPAPNIPATHGGVGRNALTLAVEKGCDEHVLRALVEPLEGRPAAGIDESDGLGRSPLTLSVESRDTQRVACLVAAGANPLVADARSLTPVRLAIRLRDAGVVDALRVLAVNHRKVQLELLRAAANEGQAALFLSLWTSFPPAAKDSRKVNDWLLQVAVSINCEGPVQDVLAKGVGAQARLSMIGLAADRGSTGMLRLLFTGNDAPIPPAAQLRLIGIAIRKGGREMVEVFLEHMALAPSTLRSALSEALQWALEEPFDQLLARAEDPAGECAALLLDAPGVPAVRLLLQRGAGRACYEARLFDAAIAMARRGDAGVLKELLDSESGQALGAAQLGAIDAAAQQAAALSVEPREFRAVLALIANARG